MFKRITFLFLAFFAFASCSHAQFDKVFGKVKDAASGLGLGEPSTDEIGNGLKEALNQGISKGVDVLSLTDGFYKSSYKILVPDEAQKVVSKLKMVPGFQDVETKLVEKMNRAAESAATKAKPIFVNAIKQMTIKDAMNLLMGEDNAATQFLNRTTSEPLYGEFNPVIVAALDEVNANEYWAECVNAYNKLPFVQKMNPDLDDHVTRKALDGLFKMVEKEEYAIRRDKGKRVSDLLKKVFAKQDSNRKV